MLYYPQSQSAGLVEFPSPESLKHRIIISTKPPKEYLESSGIKRKGSAGGKNSSEEEEEEAAGLEADGRVRKKLFYLVKEKKMSLRCLFNLA